MTEAAQAHGECTFLVGEGGIAQEFLPCGMGLQIVQQSDAHKQRVIGDFRYDGSHFRAMGGVVDSVAPCETFQMRPGVRMSRAHGRIRRIAGENGLRKERY